MKFIPLAPALAALALALAGCSKGSDTTGNITSAGPVAAKAAPAGQAWTDVVAKTDEGMLVGNPDAPIKLVEYGSRLCPACKAFADGAFEPLMKDYVGTGKVSFEFREFLIHGAADVPPALLGNCVDKAAFFPVLEQMYKGQEAFNQKLMGLTPAQQQQLQAAQPAQAIAMLADAEGIVDFMKQRGLPEAKAKQCLADKGKIDALTKQTQDKGADGTVTGTPTLIVNGTKVNAILWPDVEKALKAAGA